MLTNAANYHVIETILTLTLFIFIRVVIQVFVDGFIIFLGQEVILVVSTYV